MRRVQERVAALVQDWRGQVRALHADQSAKGRKQVRLLLGLLKNSPKFSFAGCACAQGGGGGGGGGGRGMEDEVKRKMEQEYVALCREVEGEEKKYQEHINTELRVEFAKMLESFTAALTRKANLELADHVHDAHDRPGAVGCADDGGGGASGGGGGGSQRRAGGRMRGEAAVREGSSHEGRGGVFAPLTRLVSGLFHSQGPAAGGGRGWGERDRIAHKAQDWWVYVEAESQIHTFADLGGFIGERFADGGDVLELFTRVQTMTKTRRKHFVYGDQCSLEVLLETMREQVLDASKQVLRESKLNKDIRDCVRAVLAHADAAVEAKCSELCAARLRAADVAQLPRLGFSRAAKRVNLLKQLLAQAEARCSRGDARLQATVRATQVVDDMLFQVYERASLHKRAWAARTVEITGSIDRILHEEQYERDLEPLLDALTSLKEHVGREEAHLYLYRDKLADIKTKVDKLQSEGELLTLAEARNFNEIAKRYRTLKNLREKLAAHVLLDEAPLRTFTIRHLDRLYDTAEQEIRAGVFTT
jgi:hypothetical protein